MAEFPKGRAKEEDVVRYVHSRLDRMSSLKQHRIAQVRAYEAEYDDCASLPRASKKSDFRTNTGKALVDSKLADFIAALPKYDFQPLDRQAMSKVPVVKRCWDHWWRISGMEAVIMEIAKDAFVTGTGYGWHYVKQTKKTVRFPDGKGGWTEETAFDERPVLERVAFEDAYIDANRIDRATQCVFVRHWLRSEFLNVRKGMMENAKLTDSDIPKGKRYDWTGGNGEYSFGSRPTDGQLILQWKPNENREEYVSELHFYDKENDAYFIIANDKWLNPVDGAACPNPTLHKELPIVIFTDHMSSRDYCGRGEYDVTAEPRRLKDAAVSLGIDLAKASVGAFFLSKDADYDGGAVKFGTDAVNEIGDLDGLKHFVPSVNPQFAQYIENRADDFIISTSGVDFKQNLMSPSETASKTVAKVETQKRRVNMCLRWNAWTFFARLALLRMSDIALLHKTKRSISTYGEDIADEGARDNLNGGYGVFTVKPQMFSEKVNVVPNIESMAVDSAQQRQDVLQLMQIVGSMVKADGTPVAKAEAWMEVLQPYFPHVDFEALASASEITKSPEEIMKENGLMGEAAAATQMATETEATAAAVSPNYVPPAQRSGAKKTVSTPGSAPKVMGSL